MRDRHGLARQLEDDNAARADDAKELLYIPPAVLRLHVLERDD
jgi:hypothetical protein